MTSTELETLHWQFNLTRRLAAYHLPALSDEACLFEPAPGSWTVRRASDGSWRADWTDEEPNPAPPVTIGWITWHVIWWWSNLIAAFNNANTHAHDEVAWPGSAAAARERLESLMNEWADILARLDVADLERPFAHPWKEARPLRIALAWANAELMKNVAEIGYARHLFEAARSCG